ncbi:MAG: hypothetical protein ACLQHK_04645 [Gallionellaceae bacterium]
MTDEEILPDAYFNRAKTFCKAGDILFEPLKSTNSSLDPAYLLYFHAAEMAIKAFLRFQGEKTIDLKNNYKHNIEKMYTKALSLGLAPDLTMSTDFLNVINLLYSGNQEEGFRYFYSSKTKSVGRPSIEWCSKIINLLISLVEKRINYIQKNPGQVARIIFEVGEPTAKQTKPVA